MAGLDARKRRELLAVGASSAIGSQHGALPPQADFPALSLQDLRRSRGTAGKDFHGETLAGKKELQGDTDAEYGLQAGAQG